MSESHKGLSRRRLLEKAAYTAPIIVTASVLPARASAGSAVTSPPESTPSVVINENRVVLSRRDRKLTRRLHRATHRVSATSRRGFKKTSKG